MVQIKNLQKMGVTKKTDNNATEKIRWVEKEEYLQFLVSANKQKRYSDPQVLLDVPWFEVIESCQTPGFPFSLASKVCWQRPSDLLSVWEVVS